ncbi:glutamine-rich protein 2 isoform X1 [Hoplias malabaricus]|uniref:glutamine-rich protein 2 isoform X1 n=1 Tax=Hoplias malabaricus TaxID=27720 RepID=UPI0034621EBE
MSGDISLFDLVNVSIGTPEPGSVNFGALHTLLHAILEHLHIQHLGAVWRGEDEGRDPGEPLSAASSPQSPYRLMEEKLRLIERQLAALERLPSGSELLDRSGSVNDVWQLLQLRRKVEGSEDGVTKCMALIQDLLNEIKELKDSRDSLKKEVEDLQLQFNQINVEQLADRISTVEQCLHQVEDLRSATQELKEKVAGCPQAEDLNQCVTWEVMQAALISEGQKIKNELEDRITEGSIPLTRRDSSTVNESGSSSGPVLGSSESPVSEQVTLGPDSEGALHLQVGQPWSQVSNGAERYPEAVEALRDVDQLQEKLKDLEDRVECLEGGKADQTQVQQLRDLLSDMGARDLPENVLEQVDNLKGLMETVMTAREKVSGMESLVMGPEIVSESSGLGETALESESVSSQGKISISDPQRQYLQLVYLRNAVQKLDEEVQTLKKDVAADSRAQKSSSDKLIQDQSSQLMSDIPGKILQLQAECEKLQIATNHMMEDYSQKQSHIDHLYKAVEELDEKKADREVVEMEIGIKADKRALEAKVSRIQFDTMTEQLNGMFQELLSKITGQEQDWNKVIEKISTEMESKLNRIELEPLKKQLEDRWKSIRKQLQAQPALEHDDAAGLRKQLVARFHCISCDRPVDMVTPGPHLLTVPSAPGLPPHKTNRPYSVYELEQMRQHSRSERIPEMADNGYLAMSRSCGGSHTLTYSNRRYSRLQHITQLLQTEDDAVTMTGSSLRIQPEEVDILGLDGHIYKGRLTSRALKTTESRLPTISSKEGNRKNKDPTGRFQSQKCSNGEPGYASPLRPYSAKTQGSHSASSSSVKDRPVSSMGYLYQSGVP